MTTSLEIDNNIKPCNDGESIPLKLLPIKRAKTTQQKGNSIIMDGTVIKYSGLMTAALLSIGVITSSTRQIVYKFAPSVVEHITTEAIDSLRL